MPVVSINPKNSGTITLGPPGTPVDVSCQIVNFVLDPIQNSTERPGTYCQAPVSVPGKSSWQLSFDYLQDWRVTGGLSQFLLANDGVLVDFSFHPNDALVPEAAGKVYVTAGAFGGPAGDTWRHSGNWPVDGTPTFAAPALEDETATTADDALADA